MAETRDVYMNHVQQLAFYAGARDLWVEAARRFGKTDGILGPRIWAAADSQPQGAGGFLGASRKQLFSRTIPGVIAAVERSLYRRGDPVKVSWNEHSCRMEFWPYTLDMRCAIVVMRQRIYLHAGQFRSELLQHPAVHFDAL